MKTMEEIRKELNKVYCEVDKLTRNPSQYLKEKGGTYIENMDRLIAIEKTLKWVLGTR